MSVGECVPVRCLVINLPRACGRREAIDREFGKVGLAYELWPAVDGHRLTDEDHGVIDYEGRARCGLHVLDDASVACLLSHLAVFRHLVVSEDDMLAVFEDDARLHPDLPHVLDALEGKAEKFDIVKLERRTETPYFPVHRLLRSHSLGRLRYYEHGSCGYVVTRHAAEHLLRRYPTTYWEIDLLIGQFWDNDLENVLHVDPPVVLHDDENPSDIERERWQARMENRRLRRRNVVVAARRLHFRAQHRVRQWLRFRELRRRDSSVDPFDF